MRRTFETLESKVFLGQLSNYEQLKEYPILQKLGKFFISVV